MILQLRQIDCLYVMKVFGQIIHQACDSGKEARIGALQILKGLDSPFHLFEDSEY
jgi:hypothetical protein